MKYTIVCGNLIDGFDLTGVFETEDAAVVYAENNIPKDEWHVMEIAPTI